jgi:hypothetical protein
MEIGMFGRSPSAHYMDGLLGSSNNPNVTHCLGHQSQTTTAYWPAMRFDLWHDQEGKKGIRSSLVLKHTSKDWELIDKATRVRQLTSRGQCIGNTSSLIEEAVSSTVVFLAFQRFGTAQPSNNRIVSGDMHSLQAKEAQDVGYWRRLQPRMGKTNWSFLAPAFLIMQCKAATNGCDYNTERLQFRVGKASGQGSPKTLLRSGDHLQLLVDRPFCFVLFLGSLTILCVDASIAAVLGRSILGTIRTPLHHLTFSLHVQHEHHIIAQTCPRRHSLTFIGHTQPGQSPYFAPLILLWWSQDWNVMRVAAWWLSHRTRYARCRNGPSQGKKWWPLRRLIHQKNGPNILVNTGESRAEKHLQKAFACIACR